MEFPAELKYAKDHEWLGLDGNVGKIGITDYAQGELGDIVFVELPSVGMEVTAAEPFGTIEAVKAVSDLISPVSGKVVEINGMLEDDPTVVNKQPYGDGWMIKIELSNPAEVDNLLSSEDYQKLIG